MAPHTPETGASRIYHADGYGGWLPHPETVPTADSVGLGITGVTHDGDIYCPACAKDMGLLVDKGDGWDTIEDGWTGPVFADSETDSLFHCGNHSGCLQALEGGEHPYPHSEKVGIGIEESVIVRGPVVSVYEGETSGSFVYEPDRTDVEYRVTPGFERFEVVKLDRIEETETSLGYAENAAQAVNLITEELVG